MTGKSEIERFAHETAASQSLRDEVKAIGADPEAIVRFANAKGYHFSTTDVNGLAASDELSDAQLERVAGGIISTMFCGDETSFVYATKGHKFVWF